MPWSDLYRNWYYSITPDTDLARWWQSASLIIQHPCGSRSNRSSSAEDWAPQCCHGSWVILTPSFSSCSLRWHQLGDGRFTPDSDLVRWIVSGCLQSLCEGPLSLRCRCREKWGVVIQKSEVSAVACRQSAQVRPLHRAFYFETVPSLFQCATITLLLREGNWDTGTDLVWLLLGWDRLGLWAHDHRCDRWIIGVKRLKQTQTPL